MRRNWNVSKKMCSNRQQGFSLVEMLVSVAIMGIVTAGISEMMLMNSQGTWKLFNRVDSLNAARTAVDRIAMNVRMARNIGDIYGQSIPEGDPVVYVDYGTNYFPAPNNPMYGGGQTPAGGWPSSPWTGKPYILSNQCLVVQIPIFDNSGFPKKFAEGTGTPPATTDLDNVDTYVYMVLPDPTQAGTFMLQVASFNSPESARPALNPPRTILRGIVGPLDPSTQQPRVFQFLDVAGVPLDYIGATTATYSGVISNYTGVIVNLEIKREQVEQTEKNSSTLGIKSEIFMRNNTLATLSG